MSDIVSPLLQWLNANPEWAGFVTFIISAAESVAIIGTIVPGSITMTAIGTLAGAGVIPLYATILWAILGAIVGDGISYWLGYYFKDKLRMMWPFRTNPAVLEKGEHFVNKFGVMSVFIGRFVGPVRALVPLVAGMLGMRPLLFTIANVASAIGWAPAYMLPGILLGAASLELPPDIALHVILVLLLIVLFIILCIWSVYKLFQLISKQTEQALISIWDSLEQSRYFKLGTKLLQHHSEKKLHGQLTLAFYFVFTFLLFLILAIYVKAVGASQIFVNDALFHLFRGIRNDALDHIMIYITLLGQKEIILSATALLAAWLMWKQYYRTSIHVVLLVVVTSVSVLIMKHLMHSVRPWGILNSPETFSMPSGHTSLATAIYIGIAVLLMMTHPQRKRKWLYAPAILIAFLVGISRVYLGAHWFTDVLTAWLLGASIIMLILLSFNRQYERPVPIATTLSIGILALALMYSLFCFFNIETLKKNYMQVERPTREITLQTWWQNAAPNPKLHVSLFGFPSQKINIEWQGKLADIKHTLITAGWTEPPVRDWVSSLHRIADVQSSEYLPMVSPQYLDKQPALILAKRINGAKKLVLLRLWQSDIVFKETNAPLWVGTVGLVPRSYSWLIRRNPNLNLKAQVILPSVSPLRWQWKLITPHTKNTQALLLIKTSK